MRYSFDIFLDELSCCEQGLYPVRRPNIPPAKRKFEKYDIKGTDGELLILSDNYDDVVFSVGFNYMSKNPDKWHQTYRNFRQFLKRKNTLRFSDDQDYFHRIKMIEIEENERTSLRIGRFTVKFTVEPFYYLKMGQKEFTINKETSFVNYYEKSFPIYRITGEGFATLNINGKEIQCNVSGNLYIDTKLQISYKDDGSNANTSISGDYDDMVFVEGDNTISISDNFTLSITPCWRCLI